MSASAIYEAQAARDLAHHTERVEWLESPLPMWACGTPVLPADKSSMLLSSRACMANAVIAFNTGPQDRS